MSMNKVFSDIAWNHYQFWILNDKKVLNKLNELIRDIERNGNIGIGKPEPLKNELSGFWSRRITDVHRLVYGLDEDNIYIVKCKGHYD